MGVYSWQTYGEVHRRVGYLAAGLRELADKDAKVSYFRNLVCRLSLTFLVFEIRFKPFAMNCKGTSISVTHFCRN